MFCSVKAVESTATVPARGANALGLVGVAVGPALVAVGVAVLVGVIVAVLVTVAVGVIVAVLVTVAVGEMTAVGVTVAVGFTVVGVTTCVAVGWGGVAVAGTGVLVFVGVTTVVAVGGAVVLVGVTTVGAAGGTVVFVGVITAVAVAVRVCVAD